MVRRGRIELELANLLQSSIFVRPVAHHTSERSQDVMILGGVTIGDGAIVGAGSLVTRDVAPYTIVAGNPANVIRTRYTDEQIKKLLRLKWWNIENIESFSNEFHDLDVDQQIRLLRRIRRRRNGWIQ